MNAKESTIVLAGMNAMSALLINGKTEKDQILLKSIAENSKKIVEEMHTISIVDKNENYGSAVHIDFEDGGSCTLHNVTEIHYNYQRGLNLAYGELMIAFESDIHETGATFEIGNVRPKFNPIEFETRLENCKADVWYEDDESYTH